MLTEVNSADATAHETIRRLRDSLEQGDATGYIQLLKQLSATLQIARLQKIIRRGSHKGKIDRIPVLQRLQLLNLAERWGSSPEVIGRIIRIDREPQARTERDFAAAADRLVFRQSLPERTIAGVKLVAVGAQCLSWTIPNRWGLRTEEQVNDLYNPLALAVHKIEFLGAQIAEDFASYAPTEALREIPSSKGVRLVGRRDGNAVWNHHVGAFWSENAFYRFRRNVEDGLDRLRATAFGPQDLPVIFLLHLRNGKSHEHRRELIAPVADALATKAPDAHLIVVDTSKHLDLDVGIAERDGRTSTILAGHRPDYQWPQAACFNSREGLAYERSLVTLLLGEMERLAPRIAAAA